jgi:arylsulfatase A-like enzyme
MPTLLGLCGIKIPRGVQGTNFAGHLSETSASTQGSAFTNCPVPFDVARRYGIPAYRGVRTTRYTYVRSINGPWLLYDNVSDPYQMHNLCGHSEARAMQAELENQLHAWLRRLHDEFLPPEVYLRRFGLTHYYEPNEPIGHAKSPWGDWQT